MVVQGDSRYGMFSTQSGTKKNQLEGTFKENESFLQFLQSKEKEKALQQHLLQSKETLFRKPGEACTLLPYTDEESQTKKEFKAVKTSLVEFVEHLESH